MHNVQNKKLGYNLKYFFGCLLFFVLFLFFSSNKFSNLLGIGDDSESLTYWFFMGLFQKLIVIVSAVFSFLFFLKIRNEARSLNKK